MKVKKMVKRLFAVGTGVAMLGATAMGATAAANLNSYPAMFSTDGVFNGYLVVGENSQSIDNLALTDIAASMKVAKTGGASSTTVTGDAWMVGTSSKKLEIVNNNATGSSLTGEAIDDINTFIDENDLSALADGVWATNEQNYGYNQFLFFDTDTAATDSTRIVKYSENDDDVTADHFFVASGRQIARYRLEFTTTAQSDVTDSAGSATTTGTYLDDFEDTTISIMGKEYTVVQARRPDANATASVKLVLMAGATKDTLLEGESKTYTIGGKTYDVTLSFVDSTTAKFTVNGEATNKLKDGDTYVLSDKSEVGVSEVLYQSYAGGIHSATFFLGAKKLELRHDNTTGADIASGYNLKAGSEDVDGTNVIISGTDNNVDSRINYIQVNMTADDDYFVGSGQKLSDVIAASGDEKDVLLAGAFDIQYNGLTEEKTHDLRLKTASARRYKLALFDGDGNAVDLPIAYAESATNLSIGEETRSGARNSQKRLILGENDIGGFATDGGAINAQDWQIRDNVYKGDYFVLSAGTPVDGSAKSYLMQYQGSDRQSKSGPKIKFKNIGSGESLEYSVSSVAGGSTGTVATIKIGGYSFFAQNATTMESDDFGLQIDLDASGTIVNNTVNFTDSYGSTWGISSGNVTGMAVAGNGLPGTGEYVSGGHVRIRRTVLNADDYDTIQPSITQSNITTAAGPELRADLTGVTLITPDGESEVSYGYTSMGTFITYNQPSSDPQELTFQYPEKQRLPQVYVTSGATTSAKKGSGDSVAVQVVDATRLDSEIADSMAQNLIVVGGPCVNTVAAELLGNPAECTSGFTPGKARIKLFEHANGNVAMLVAGYSGADTRLAGRVIAHRASELSGMEVEVEGTTYSDATISTPSVTGGQ